MPLTKTLVTLMVVSALSLCPVCAQARFNMEGFHNATTGEVLNDNMISAQPAGIYKQLNQFLGRNLYNKLLENDRFLKLQDIVLNSLRANYPAIFS